MSSLMTTVATMLSVALINLKYSETCENDWTLFPETDRCYKIFVERQSYQQASKTCRDNNGKLANINNAKENDFIFKLVKTKIPPYSDMILLGAKTSTPGTKKGWNWEDGRELEYTNWAPNQPDDIIFNGEHENCLSMFNKDNPSQWNDHSCSLPLPFACQTENEKVKSCACDATNGWTSRDGSAQCYKIFHEQKTHKDASQTCRKNNAILAKALDKEESDFIFNLALKEADSPLPTYQELWLGGNTSTPSAGAAAAKGWHWEDGTELKYFNWGKKEPNNDAGQAGRTENCLAIVLFAGQNYDISYWNDFWCMHAWPFVCAKAPECQ